MNMKDVICRLCLKVPHNEFLLIDETLRQGLDVLSMRMNFDVNNDPFMCKDCMENIKKLLSFILACLNSEKSILLLDTAEDKGNIDIRDVYTHNSKDIIHVDSYICRFCITKVEEKNGFPLDDIRNENTYLDMFEGYMFKMDLNIVKNPLICLHCRESMRNYMNFLWHCHKTEEKINTYRQNEKIGTGEKIMLSKVFRQYSESTLEYTCRQMYHVKKEPSAEEITEMDFIDIHNPIEEVKEEFSTRDENIYNSILYQNSNTNDNILCTCVTKDNYCLGCSAKSNEARVSENLKREIEFLEMSEKFGTDSKELGIKAVVSDSTHTHSKFGICICNEKKKSCSKCISQFELISRGPTVYKCKLCSYQGAWIKPHMLKHRDISEVTMYQCTACDFKTKHRNSLKSHSLIHKTEADITMFKCTSCDYKTKRKCDFKNHSLTHKTEAEVTMYKCTTCDFRTICKKYLKSHSLTHKTEAELTMYKCTTCDFKTKYRNSLRSHSLIHKTEAEVTVYKCTACDYKTIRKNDFRSHSLTHKTKAEVTMHKCTACDFKTKHKDSLKRHSLTHKTEAEVTMYKCVACDYKTMRKDDLKSHSLTHKTEAEISMYKCTACDFKTMRKNCLTSHLLTHKKETEVPMYNCMDCDFKTKRKKSLKTHSLTHMNETEVAMYKCTVCEFKTRHKNSIKRHLLTHKTEAEVTMYKCIVCDFKTKHKDSLKSHLLTHNSEAEVKM